MVADMHIQVDIKSLDGALGRLSKGEIASATAEGLNNLAKGARLAVVDRMKEVFDHPRPFTLNAFYNKPARADDLEAWVATRDYAPGGTPAVRYLGPQIYGGTRDQKRLEKALAPYSEGQYVVPGPAAPTNASGDLRPGFVTQMLSRMGLMADPTQNASTASLRRLRGKGRNAKGQRSEYFVGHEKGNGRPTGIFRLVGPGNVEMVLRFVPRAPRYQIRLPVEQIVQDRVSDRAERVMTRILKRTLRKRLP